MINRCVPGLLLNGSLSVFERAGIGREDQVTSSSCDKYAPFSLQLTNDVQKTYKEILYFGGASVFLSYILLIILSAKCVVAFAVWMVVFGVAFVGFTAAAVLWQKWYYMYEDLNEIPKEMQLKSEQELTNHWLYGAIAMTVVEVLLICLIVFIFKKIRIAVVLFQQGGAAILSVPCLPWQPFVTAACYFLFVVGQCYVFVLILSASERSVNQLTYPGRVIYENEPQLVALKWVYIFCILWTAQFLFACETLFIAGVVSQWYFSRRKYGCCSGACGALQQSYWNVFRYHMGSAALGAAFIAIIQLMRLGMYYFRKLYLNNKNNQCAQKVAKCAEGCMACFQKFVEFLTNNAYIGVGKFSIIFHEYFQYQYKVQY